jgi:hypothetical protein
MWQTICSYIRPESGKDDGPNIRAAAFDVSIVLTEGLIILDQFYRIDTPFMTTGGLWNVDDRYAVLLVL